MWHMEFMQGETSSIIFVYLIIIFFSYNDYDDFKVNYSIIV